MDHLGIVTIGRNEGERLRRCLMSVLGRGLPVVYVDSASTDGSPELARALGAEVVELDTSRPVCVPRARNEGFERLRRIDPDVRFVQFVDGDCEMVEGWPERAYRVLQERPDVALVTGRRRERFPERSTYNRLADLEWDMPLGEIEGSHGDIMVRAEAFRQVGGFDATVFVGEDYDLCVRLRKEGWVLLRIDAEMTLHDMAMTRFGQWWRRCVRSGYGFAEGALLHGAPPQRHWVREVRSILFWGLTLPAMILALAWPARGASLVLLAGYLYLYGRIHRYGISRGWPEAEARLFARWCILAKFPMALGLIVYWFRRLTRRQRRIIEYKGAGPAAGPHDFGAGVEAASR
jgi:cellulose synthase/poly-beta-1,6-N-acetylglucosamine synthase-like glycosyltransferase